MITEQAVTFVASDGVVLEGRLGLPASPAAGLVACHPHPLYGGDMDNPVVIRVAEVAADRSLASLRFNFRGVGGSTGRHGAGQDEERDVEAALAHLGSVLGGARPVGLAGYSFGATVAARVMGRGAHEMAAALALIAPPIAMVGEEVFAPLAGLRRPLLIVAGNRDEYCPAPALAALGARLPQATVHVIEGANHFFFGKLFPLGEVVAAWAKTLETGQAARRSGAG